MDSPSCAISTAPENWSCEAKASICVISSAATGGRTGGLAVGEGSAVGRMGVLVGDGGVSVGGTGVSVGGTGVSVGGLGVSVGGIGVSVRATAMEVDISGTGVAVGSSFPQPTTRIDRKTTKAVALQRTAIRSLPSSPSNPLGDNCRKLPLETSLGPAVQLDTRKRLPSVQITHSARCFDLARTPHPGPHPGPYPFPGKPDCLGRGLDHCRGPASPCYHETGHRSWRRPGLFSGEGTEIGSTQRFLQGHKWDKNRKGYRPRNRLLMSMVRLRLGLDFYRTLLRLVAPEHQAGILPAQSERVL